MNFILEPIFLAGLLFKVCQCAGFPSGIQGAGGKKTHLVVQSLLESIFLP